MVDKLLRKYPDTDQEQLLYYAKLFKVIGTPNDLHSDNVMKRGNTFIPTDPFFRRDRQKIQIELSSYATRINGQQVIEAERLSNGQNRVRGLRYSIPALSWTEIKEASALRSEPFYAVQPYSEGIPSVLSSVRHERIPEGTTLISRLQQAA